MKQRSRRNSHASVLKDVMYGNLDVSRALMHADKKSIQDVINTMNDEQKAALYFTNLMAVIDTSEYYKKKYGIK